MKKTFNVLVGLTLILGLLSACNDSKPKHSKYTRSDTYSAGEIHFAADESFSPIVNEEVKVFEATYRDAILHPIYTDEYEAMNLLLKDSVCLVFASRQFTEKEMKALKVNVSNPTAIPIAYDGLSLIVHKSNNDTCIAVKDIKRILGGEVSKWNELYPNSKLGDIEVIFDNKNSSTVRWCVDSILDGKPINSPNIYAAKTSAEVINYVEQHANSIGIIGSNWLNDKRDTTNVTFKKNIHVMSVSRMDTANEMNSWKPYQYYLYNGNYPLIRTIYALLVDPIHGLPWGFSQFVSSPKGQLIIFRSSLLPYRGDLTVREVNVKSE